MKHAIFVDEKTQLSEDADSSQVNILVCSFYENLSKIFCAYRQNYSKIYIERQEVG